MERNSNRLPSGHNHLKGFHFHVNDTAKTVKRNNDDWIIFSAALAVFMVRLDGYIVNISLPTISRYFQTSIVEVSWVVLAYLLVMTSSMLTFGKLGDRIGLRKIFTWGYGVFILGSLCCGLAPGIHSLEISRSIQGLGGAMMVTSAFAIVTHYLPPEHTGRAYGICAFANSLGIMVGAPLGGLITGFFSWRWIFLINIPIGLIAIIVARRALRAEKMDARRPSDAPFDFAGSLLCFIGLSALVYVLSMGREAGWASTTILLVMGVAFFSLAAFGIRERTHSDPILDFSIFRNKAFLFANMTTLLAMMLLAGGNFILPFYLEMTKGLKPEYVGAIILIYSVVYMPVGLYSGALSDRIRPTAICSAATLLSFIACAVFTYTLSLTGLSAPILFLVLLALSYGFFFAANNHLVMSLAPADHQGTASGIYSTVMNVGMVLGVCLFEGAFSHALPPGISPKPLALGAYYDAFQQAFFLGSVICLLAFLSSLLTKRKMYST